MIDPNTRERRQRVHVHLTGPITPEKIAAVIASLEAAAPAARAARLRALAEALPQHVPERAAMLATLDRLAALPAQPPSDAGPARLMLLAEAIALHERAQRRLVLRGERARRAAGGAARAAAIAETNRARDERVRADAAALRADGRGRDAAAILADRHGLSASTIRRILRRG